MSNQQHNLNRLMGSRSYKRIDQNPNKHEGRETPSGSHFGDIVHNRPVKKVKSIQHKAESPEARKTRLKNIGAISRTEYKKLDNFSRSNYVFNKTWNAYTKGKLAGRVI